MTYKRNPKPRKILLKTKDFSYPIVDTMVLSRPTKIKEASFFKTVLSRRSANSFNGISGLRLSQLLYFSAKAFEIGFSDTGDMISRRPAPSAGGIHPIDIIVWSPSIEPGLHYYNPVDHSLNKLSLNPSLINKFVEQTHSIKDSSKKATILWMIAHKYRTNAKYNNSESLVWRDAGCLLYCLNLVAAALNIQCCLLGSLGEPYISNLFRKHGKVEGVGGCLVG
jgi:SagB-type dehydrogenase family enzyme